MNNIEIGKIGEEYAYKYLKGQNFKIICQNFYCRYGEIDLIAIDPSQNQLVFIEVKFRTSEDFGSPQDSITFKKKQRIVKTALTYIKEHPTPFSWRFDLIALKLERTEMRFFLTHFKNFLNG